MLNEQFQYRALRREAVSLLGAMPDGSVDSFVTDPPFGINLKLQFSKRADHVRSIAGDGKVEAIKLWRAWVPEAYRVAKPDSLHLVFGTWRCPWAMKLLSRQFRVVGCIVWDKRVFGLGHFTRGQHEFAFVCAKGKPPRFIDPPPADVWQHQRIMRPQHPCEKPIDLLRRAVRFTTLPGQLVADPFAGIFSTGVAALLEGRRFLGGEIEPRHWHLGRKRMTDAAEQILAANLAEIEPH